MQVYFGYDSQISYFDREEEEEEGSKVNLKSDVTVGGGGDLLLPNFSAFKSRFNFNQTLEDLRLSIREELLDSNVSIEQVINHNFQFSVYTDSQTQINRDWRYNELLRILWNKTEGEEDQYSVVPYAPRARLSF